VNGQPTFFYSDFTAFGTSVTGKIRPGGGDDDYVGFALGFQPGDSTNAAANYLLVDWKQGTQSFDFGAPSNSPGGNALSGLAVSRVTGIPDADEFWQHKNLASTPAGSGLQELARGTNLGNTGWVDNTNTRSPLILARTTWKSSSMVSRSSTSRASSVTADWPSIIFPKPTLRTRRLR